MYVFLIPSVVQTHMVLVYLRELTKKLWCAVVGECIVGALATVPVYIYYGNHFSLSCDVSHYSPFQLT